MAFADGKYAYLISKLTPSGTMTVDRNLGISSGRLYLVNDNQEEWINFTSNTLTGSYYVLGGLTRDVHPITVPMASQSTWKTWLANQKCTVVQTHDQMIDASTPYALEFTTTTARDIALWGNGVANKPYNNIYVTSTGLFYGYNTLTQQWIAYGTSTPLPTAITGEVRSFAWSSAPTWWFVCNGSAVSRTTYSDLFSAIWTLYGIGDGSTTFNIPDTRGRVIGWYDAWQTEFSVIGKTWGVKAHTLTEAEMPSHTHNIINVSGGSGGSARWPLWQTQFNAWYALWIDWGSPQAIANTWGWLAHNNIQPYITMNYIIKY
jgi:microcystin-dependent protein